MNTKSIVATGAAIAVLTGGALVVNHEMKLESKPGYQVEATGDGKYDVYTLKDGKKTIMGRDLTADQADQFLSHKLGRHNQ